jgi:ABC-type dipeptide/oligopeptide/nickel transport system permease component
MVAFVTRRIFLSIFVLFTISFVVFGLTHLSGDPAILMTAPDATAEDIARFREQAGFNDPLLVQYGRFLSAALRGDFGNSLRHHQPSLPMVLDRLPATLQLSISAMVLTLGFALPLGVLAALRRGTVVDAFAMTLGVVGQSMPNFWLGILLIFLFAVHLRWLPSSGRGGFVNLILPALTMAFNLMAFITRLVRSNMLEVLSQPYIRTARGKGLREVTVVVRHALRNALIPVVTVVGLQFGYILGGAVVVETVFSWPGVGLLTINAIYNRDFPLVQASVFVLAVAIVLINMSVDILYSILDPRIRIETT